MEFAAETVWACAAAAYRINEGYFKEDVWNRNSPAAFISKKANKQLVKAWLRDTNFSYLTEEDYAKGTEIRNHFKSYTLKAIAGQLNEFQLTAMRIAAMESFTGRNMLEFAIISCLPDVVQRDHNAADLKREVYASEQLRGIEGEAIVGDVTVMSCRYNKEFNKYRIEGRMGDSFVDFWYKEELKGDVRIKAKIKAHRGNKTTQLNYVKKI